MSTGGNGKGISPGGLLILHACLGIAMLAGALLFHVLTLKHIRAFHPEYPRVVTLAPYTPVEIARPFHLAGPVVLPTVTAVALLISAVPVVRRSRARSLNLVVIGLNLGLLLAAIYAYSIAAIQLAGVAALFLRGGS